MYIAMAFTDDRGTLVSLHQDCDSAKFWMSFQEKDSALLVTRKIEVGEEFGLAMKLHTDACLVRRAATTPV